VATSKTLLGHGTQRKSTVVQKTWQTRVFSIMFLECNQRGSHNRMQQWCDDILYRRLWVIPAVSVNAVASGDDQLRICRRSLYRQTLESTGCPSVETTSSYTFIHFDTIPACDG